MEMHSRASQITNKNNTFERFKMKKPPMQQGYRHADFGAVLDEIADGHESLRAVTSRIHALRLVMQPKNAPTENVCLHLRDKIGDAVAMLETLEQEIALTLEKYK
jgi:hypothetical protein